MLTIVLLMLYTLIYNKIGFQILPYTEYICKALSESRLNTLIVKNQCSLLHQYSAIMGSSQQSTKKLSVESAN